MRTENIDPVTGLVTETAYSNVFEAETFLLPDLVFIRAGAQLKPNVFSKKEPGVRTFVPTEIDVYLYNETAYRIPIKLGHVVFHRDNEEITLLNEAREVTLVPSAVERLHMETELVDQDALHLQLSLKCLVKNKVVTRNISLKRLTVKEYQSRSKAFWWK